VRRIIGLLLLAVALAAPASASAVPSVSAGDVSVIEGDSGTTTAHFTLTLSAVSATDVTVQYATADGTAKAPADYSSKSGTATIPAGSLTTQVDVPVNGDAIDENDETFTVHLSNAVGASIAGADGTGTILDDDPVPTLSVNDNSVTEANTVNRAITFTVHLSTASARTVSIHYATADGSALAGADYQAVSGDLSFSPGTTSRTVSVRVLPDTVDEPTETFKLLLSSPVDAVVADGTGVGSIADNDPAPTLVVSDVRVREGGTAVFTVSLSHVSGRAVSVQYATTGGTAQSGLDFTASKARVGIPPGATSAQIFVPTFDDGIYEPTESFSLTLSKASNAGIRDSHGSAAIVDNDRPPRPVVTAFSVRPHAFRALRIGRRGAHVQRRRAGARVTFRLSAAASAHFGVERLRRGGRVTRLRGGFSVASHAGLNAFRFNGRLAGRRLHAGRYRLVLVAVGRARVRSIASRAPFRIIG